MNGLMGKSTSTVTQATSTRFSKVGAEKTRTEFDKSMGENKCKLELSQPPISKLDEIIQRLYENNIDCKIFDELFAKMTANYEAELQD